jgi:hypothetical protein
MLTVSMTSPPQDFEVLDFDIEKEQWNEYDLSDGNRVKGRVILTRLFQIFDKSQPQGQIYSGETRKMFVTYSPSGNPQRPTNPTTIEEINKLPRIPVNADTSNERWNVYRIIKNGKIVKVKLVVDEIYKIEGLYEPSGLPSYQITSSELIVPGKDTKTYTQ